VGGEGRPLRVGKVSPLRAVIADSIGLAGSAGQCIKSPIHGEGFIQSVQTSRVRNLGATLESCLPQTISLYSSNPFQKY